MKECMTIGMNEKEIPEYTDDISTVFVSFRNGVSGMLYSVYTVTEYSFMDFKEFLLKLNQLCEEINSPQADALKENTCTEKMTEQEIWQKCAGKRTLILQMYLRQKAGLQGVVIFPKEKIPFQSAMELLEIMAQKKEEYE